MKIEHVDEAFYAARDIRSFTEILEEFKAQKPEDIALCIQRELTEKDEQELSSFYRGITSSNYEAERFSRQNRVLALPVIQQAIRNAALSAIEDAIDAAHERLKEAANK